MLSSSDNAHVQVTGGKFFNGASGVYTLLDASANTKGAVIATASLSVNGAGIICIGSNPPVSIGSIEWPVLMANQQSGASFANLEKNLQIPPGKGVYAFTTGSSNQVGATWFLL